MITLPWKILGALAIVSAASGWGYVEGRSAVQTEWDADSARIAQALAVAFTKSAAETEKIREVFIEYKQQAEVVTGGLERDVAASRSRLRVKATCSNMPNGSTVPGGTQTGTVELDPAARPAYFALRRGLAEQLGLLNLCRAELKKRAAH